MALHTRLLVACKAAAPVACTRPAVVALLPDMAVVRGTLAGSYDTRAVAELAVVAVAHFVSQSWQLPGNNR